MATQILWLGRTGAYTEQLSEASILFPCLCGEVQQVPQLVWPVGWGLESGRTAYREPGPERATGRTHILNYSNSSHSLITILIRRIRKESKGTHSHPGLFFCVTVPHNTLMTSVSTTHLVFAI